MNKQVLDLVNRPNIKGFIFDMDGTLLDSEVWTINMMKNLVEEKTGIISNLGHEELAGLGYPDKMTKILGYHDQDMIDLAIATGSKYYCEIAKPINGVNEILSAIKKTGKKMTIGTNGHIDLLMPAFDKLSVRMNVYQGSIKGVIDKKPEPDIFLAAIAKIGLEPHEVAIFEDSESGTQAALAAKVPVENILVFNQHKRAPKGFNTFETWL